jgi:pyruvate/2-oxoglutarate dehydrogenase complex dihydrolipoamide acyltransferase (E2) component
VAKIPSTASGKVTSIKFVNDDVAPVGHVLLTIDTEGEAEAAVPDHKADKHESKD